MQDQLAAAIAKRQNGDAEGAYAILTSLVAKHPDDSQVQYQMAWTCDNLGHEREAIPYYERALEMGLSGDDRCGALLGLGSTFRTLGDYERAVATLRDGVGQFPDDRAMQVFYAMALFNAGEHAEAMEILLRNLAETSGDERIQRYRRAILLYAPDLQKIWE